MGITTDTERSVVGVDDGKYMELLNIESLAPAYDSSETYTTGDVCSYGGKLYVLMGGSATGAWDSSLWEETTLGEVMEKLKLGKNTTTESGDIVSFTNPYNRALPFVSVKADITAQQSGSGDPSPDNVRPITGFTGANVYVRGVNLWDEEWDNGVISSSTGQNVNGTTNVRSKNYSACLPSTSYYVYIPSPRQIRMYWYDADKNFISSPSATQKGVYTTPSNCYYFRFVVWETTYGATYNNDISINYPSTDHDYHAYSGEDYATSFGSTVYGGTLNVTTGVLTVTHQLLNTQTAGATAETINGLSCVSISYAAIKNSDLKTDIYCSHLRFAGNAASNVAVGTLVNRTASYYNLAFCLPSEFTTVASFRSWASTNNVQVKLPLLNQQTIQLTPTEVKTLLGQNNVWADTGEVEVTYYTRG